MLHMQAHRALNAQVVVQAALLWGFKGLRGADGAFGWHTGWMHVGLHTVKGSIDWHGGVQLTQAGVGADTVTVDYMLGGWVQQALNLQHMGGGCGCRLTRARMAPWA